jgi:hypothetical protein
MIQVDMDALMNIFWGHFQTFWEVFKPDPLTVGILAAVSICTLILFYLGVEIRKAL